MRIRSEFDYLISSRKKVNLVEHIKIAAAEACGITLEEMYLKGLNGKLSRKKERVMARQLVQNELHIKLRYTQEKAGAVFGQHHSTVIHAIKCVKDCKKGFYKGMEKPLETFEYLVNN